MLYIPHGSDKTESATTFFTTADAFISHMVQIKRTIQTLPLVLEEYFISHMVQIKHLPVPPFCL
ncbi:MAG: hypothetical protein RMJ67_10140, partial [Elusimicrobiota bacterium]|nr:hypothetical protein [Endomicrobiia bacterium]MDW8166851.1 hypothetical protein [Elusimicrobiota bacterium]